MIKEIIQFSRSVADRKHTLAPVELFLCVCNLPGAVEIEITVTHKLRMHAEIFHIGLGDHAADGIGDAADAELKGASAGDVGEDIGGYFTVSLCRGGAFDRGDREIAFNHRIHITDADMVIGETGNGGHRGVHFHHDMLCSIEDFLLGAVRQTIGEIAVFVHRGDRYHCHIHRSVTLLVIDAVMAEHHRGMISLPLIDVFAIQCGAVPQVIGKRPVRVIFDGVNGNHGDRVADFYIVNLSAAGCKSGVQRLGIGARLAVIYPVTILYDLNSLLRCAEFLHIKSLIIHIWAPPVGRESNGFSLPGSLPCFIKRTIP